MWGGALPLPPYLPIAAPASDGALFWHGAHAASSHAIEAGARLGLGARVWATVTATAYLGGVQKQYIWRWGGGMLPGVAMAGEASGAGRQASRVAGMGEEE